MTSSTQRSGPANSRPAPLWTPSPQRAADTNMSVFMRAQGLADYRDLWRWSVDDLPGFWRAIWEHFDVQADGDPATVLASEAMPGAVWFPDVALSYAEHVFRDKDDADIALQHASELRGLDHWTWGALREHTARIRAGLRAMGIGPGDRVAAYMPNIPETLAAFLATASLGATWSSCSPDLGARTVIDRFSQIEPKVVLAVDGYRYGGRDYDRAEIVAELRAALPTVIDGATLPYLGLAGDWEQRFPQTAEPLAFERVAFDHPLWILYSSGTTGMPKAIVQGHGGILLEHLKALSLHVDARAGDRIFWFTTTGWMMWNFLISALLTPASIVLYDGNPSHPGLGVLWDMAEQARITCLGSGAAYLHSCMKAGVRPAAGRDLSALRAVGATGSPLSPEAFRWVYDELGDDVWLFSVSGGTDVCTAFVGGCPILPVFAGELQAACLGVAVEAYDDAGHAVVDEVGELVITRPMPSMPLRFVGDPGADRYRESYFSTYPGVWRHGDWIRFTTDGTAVIQGRSDATINRGGIRMGTAEIYRAVLAVADVLDALVVDVPTDDGGVESWMPLFVVMADDRTLTDDVRTRIAQRVREDCSPRHVPDEIIQIAEVPRTLTGKALEVPVKKVLMGRDPDKAASRAALANPAAFDWFVDFRRQRKT